jgi:hypothetical protein
MIDLLHFFHDAVPIPSLEIDNVPDDIFEAFKAVI